MSNDRINFARWLIARSDVETAKLFLNPEEPKEKELVDYIDGLWPGLMDIGRYREVYEEAGLIEAKLDDTFEIVPKQDRFQMISWMMSNLGGCQKVLDYGCSRGIWAIHLHNTYGKEWALYDIDHTSIDAARELVSKHAGHPEAFSFHVVPSGEPDEDPSWKDKHFDCALLLEMLEHVRDPVGLLKKVEGSVRPGGVVIISVPSGPVEYSMWVDHPERKREHLREYTFEDLVELLGRKTSLYFQYCHYGIEKYTNMRVGHYVVAWQVDDAPFEEINLERKLWPRPMPFVSLPGF